MTHIPGTGPVPGSRNSVINNPDSSTGKQDLFTSLNVKELKHPKEKDITETLWYLQLKYWILFGSLFSVIFAIFSFTDIKFLFLTPLGPYVGYLSWHIRKWIKKHSEKFDSLA